MTAAEFDKMISTLPPQYASAVNTLGKKGFAEQYANILGLAMEGEKRKLDQREDFLQAIAFQRIFYLAQTTLNELSTSAPPVPPEEIKNYYDSHSAEFEEAKVRGIYVTFDPGPEAGQPGQNVKQQSEVKRTEQEAKTRAEDLRQKLLAGEDISAMAKTESDHATSSNGGDFGYVRRSQMPPEMGSVIFALERNLISEPLRDRFGFFLFKVEEKRFQSLDSVRATIEANLRQQVATALVEKVKTDYPIMLDNDFFSDPTLGTPVPSPPQPPK
ncbi:MAG: hypothetical protein A3F68_06545 [Acidobacteria bacterium RIFCSPLOWO2_12_FULL_54_10]|nr:MAG: hypothetical protein A3F68_06545 [Acidobacteria bacterium RIFCSPLOWO2_12_FULL_54_10]